MKKELKDAFLESFASLSYGATAECHCGKIHFDINDQYDAETNQELERWYELSKEHPDSYQGHDGSIMSVSVSGCYFVPDCTCGSINRYKQFIDENDEAIVTYLKKKADILKKAGERIAV